MKTGILSVLGVMVSSVASAAGLPFVGLYQTIDDATNTPKSIVALYEYNDGDELVLAGRIVALYGADGKISETVANPVKVADNVAGHPKYVGMDIIWDMEWDADDNKFEDGKIMDPQSGKVYSSVIWRDADKKLNVRGKIGPFGRTQNWNTVSVSDVPAELQNLDTKNWKPTIRK